MGKDDEIDDQVHADWEFTRRAEQLMSRLRTQGNTGPSTVNPENRQQEPQHEQDKETPPKDE